MQEAWQASPLRVLMTRMGRVLVRGNRLKLIGFPL